MTNKPWRDALPIHPAAELFPLMSQDELRELAEDIKKYGLKSRVTFWTEKPGEEKFLLDGRNRLDAMELVDLDPHSCSQVTLYGNQGVDPYAYVISANIHRRHLTVEQRRELIAKLLKADPTKSDRQIAKAVDASHPHVAKVREELEKAGDVETVTTRTDTRGRQQPAKRRAHHRGDDRNPDYARRGGMAEPEPEPPTDPADIIDECVAGIEARIQIALGNLSDDEDFRAVLFERIRSALDKLKQESGGKATEQAPEPDKNDMPPIPARH